MYLFVMFIANWSYRKSYKLKLLDFNVHTIEKSVFYTGDATLLEKWNHEVWVGQKMYLAWEGDTFI
jgi:hypothetical protein